MRIESPIASLLTVLLLAPSVAAQVGGQGQGTGPQGSAREAMWPAPTAADWKRPVLIQWQRTWDDAVALSKETNRPILVCINMDGEIASEHYAGIRYRMPEITALYEPYVCVIASVYRHNPRDYDEHGHRVECPRFGGVTCGEHIAIEPVLYEKFMDGRRIAPRHIMVELDGQETYDVFYAFDTDSVFKAIREGITTRDKGPITQVRGDRSIVERVASTDSKDRTAVEQAYLEGDAALRRSLLDAANSLGDKAPVELLRLGVMGLDTELSKKARGALAQTSADGAPDLIAQALRVPMEASEREQLVAALTRLGENSPRARTLAVVHTGLARRSTHVDVEGWAKALDGSNAYTAASEAGDAGTRLDAVSHAAVAKPEDAQARIEQAEAALAYALDPETQRSLAADPKTRHRYEQLLYEDARRAALRAKALGATGWRVDAVLAVAAYYLGEIEESYRLAEATMGGMPPNPESRGALAALGVFAEARQKAIVDAIRARQPWQPQWLTDVHAAYSVIGKHPHATDAHIASHYDFIKALDGTAQAARVLDAGIERFPESWLLHERLRGRILEEHGVAGLEPAYAELRAKHGSGANMDWFSGYASIVVAEAHRRRGRTEEAIAAYDRAIAHYERGIAANETTRDTADHYVAVALAGRARIAYENGDDDKALAELLAAIERKPEAMPTIDGLNLSAVDTTRMLRARLRANKKDEQLAKLDAVLGSLDPELLRLPAYNFETPPEGATPPAGNRGRRGRRGG